ncbi:hypothetical protein LUZ60_013184 [Juncus effusus]|nr:hypothetical protein LUZ60_013184 [Juncus effusus]
MTTFPPQFLPPPPPATAAAAAETAVTLLVKHLPEAIPEEMLSRLFSHYGASSVRPCVGGKLRNCAFVDFRDETTANQAQSQLNRLRFLGKTLIVERTNQPTNKNKDQIPKESSPHALKTVQDNPSVNNKSTVGFGSEPIESRLGVDYPFPPHLEYQYPPPDGNILTNIVNALIAVPRFYTQVLHLMNKMNLPAPFRLALPTPPLPAVPLPDPTGVSSDESELESSDEDSERRERKRKRETIVGPAVDKSVAHESVGIKSSTLVPKEVPILKKNTPVLQIKIGSKPVQKETEKIEETESEKEKIEEKEKEFLTKDEIEKGKMPPEQILSLPMFKNYAPGNPTTVLYIKNLAKDVVSDDFYFIFGSLFGDINAAKSGLSVKLMQEGRMRGQAFVTFPSVDIAQHALNLVNGYVFKGKPMIIQFGRNPGSK